MKKTEGQGDSVTCTRSKSSGPRIHILYLFWNIKHCYQLPASPPSSARSQSFRKCAVVSHLKEIGKILHFFPGEPIAEKKSKKQKTKTPLPYDMEFSENHWLKKQIPLRLRFRQHEMPRRQKEPGLHSVIQEEQAGLYLEEREIWMTTKNTRVPGNYYNPGALSSLTTWKQLRGLSSHLLQGQM